jgi:hypothetical protein
MLSASAQRSKLSEQNVIARFQLLSEPLSLAKAPAAACKICDQHRLCGLLDFTLMQGIFRTIAALLTLFEIGATVMKIVKTAVLLTSALSLAGAAAAAEPVKVSEQIIEVEIQSEPMRMSASAKKPSPTLHANTRMSATVAQLESDGTVTLDCESQHIDKRDLQLQVEPR